MVKIENFFMHYYVKLGALTDGLLFCLEFLSENGKISKKTYFFSRSGRVTPYIDSAPQSKTFFS